MQLCYSVIVGMKHIIIYIMCHVEFVSFALKTYLLHSKLCNRMNEFQSCFSCLPWSDVCREVFVTDTHTSVHDETRSKHRKLNLITQVSWESTDVPKRLKFTSNKNPRTQATCCFSNKTTATQCCSHCYSLEARLTSQCYISIDPEKASPTSHQ